MCWASFLAILGRRQPMARGLDTPGRFKQECLSQICNKPTIKCHDHTPKKSNSVSFPQLFLEKVMIKAIIWSQDMLSLSRVTCILLLKLNASISLNLSHPSYQSWSQAMGSNWQPPKTVIRMRREISIAQQEECLVSRIT